jgi:hypothetical protein
MGEKYFQTWPYVSKINRIKFIGKPLVKIIQFICGLFDHELSKTEWGYGGGDTADCWCRWCNKLIEVPKDSIRFRFKGSSEMMKLIGKNIKEIK